MRPVLVLQLYMFNLFFSLTIVYSAHSKLYLISHDTLHFIPNKRLLKMLHSTVCIDFLIETEHLKPN